MKILKKPEKTRKNPLFGGFFQGGFFRVFSGFFGFFRVFSGFFGFFQVFSVFFRNIGVSSHLIDLKFYRQQHTSFLFRIQPLWPPPLPHRGGKGKKLKKGETVGRYLGSKLSDHENIFTVYFWFLLPYKLGMDLKATFKYLGISLISHSHGSAK